MERQTILEGYSDLEKGAYLGAIASIATADREASEEEVAYIGELCDAAQISAEQKEIIKQAATELTAEELNRCLDVLKGSDLRHSLVTDLIAFAKSDATYSEEEQKSVQHISDYLGISQQQFSLLDQFAQKATAPQEGQQPSGPQNFFGLTGLQDKMKGAGINTNSLLKGVLGIAAPLLLSGMLGRGLGRRRSGGMFGGGGMGGMFGGGLGGMGGGLGSVIGMLSGGRGFGSTGGLLGRVLGGGF